MIAASSLPRHWERENSPFRIAAFFPTTINFVFRWCEHTVPSLGTGVSVWLQNYAFNVSRCLSSVYPIWRCGYIIRSWARWHRFQMFLFQSSVSANIFSLKLTFRKYPAIHTNYIITHCTTWQYMTRYLGRNEILNTKYIEFNSVAISVLWLETAKAVSRPD